MHPNWRIPEENEKPFRDALNHAGLRHVSELHTMLEQMPEEQLAGSIGLCGFVSAYTAIDVVSRRWPTDAGLRQMAQGIAEEGTEYERFGVTEQNVYLWLSQCAIGLNAYTDVFADAFDDPYKFMAAPFFFTANIIARFRPRESDIGDFLDLIETAYEQAFAVDLNLLPALMVRNRLAQKTQEQGASTGNQ
ncbi:MAG TPA: hypothetical protein VK817_17585 [Trebonia sp.]|jgi:hypothetical protein|nr:hypothetical protein [Trebonia sp.]